MAKQKYKNMLHKDISIVSSTNSGSCTSSSMFKQKYFLGCLFHRRAPLFHTATISVLFLKTSQLLGVH